MSMPGDFGIVFESLATAGNMAKGFLALKTEGERQQLVIDLQSKILEAQRAALESRHMAFDTHDDLQRAYEEIDRLKDQAAMLATLTRRDGLYYAPVDDDPLCPRCVEVDRRCVHLTNSGVNALSQRHWTCPQCEKQFKIGDAKPRQTVTVGT